MSLDPRILDLVAVAGAACALLALIVGIAAHLRIRRLRKAYRLLQGGRSEDDVVTAVNRQVAEVQRLRAEVETSRHEVAETRRVLADAVRHVAVVRYDAFGDMGGRLSFSAALLDDEGDGLVLTTIVGRNDSRTYAKGLRAGRSDQTLSSEEEQAISYALERDAPADGSGDERGRRDGGRRAKQAASAGER